MAMASLSSLTTVSISAHNHHRYQTIKFPRTSAQNLINSPFIRHQPVNERRSSPKFKMSSFFSSTPDRKSNVLVPTIATVFLGSLVFMGSFKVKPASPQPAQETESLEQKREIDSRKSDAVDEDEDELMCVKLFEGNPRDVEALKMVVNVKMKKGKTNEAVEYVEKLIELQPNEMEWRLLQALCYEMIGNFGKAKSLYKNIIKQRPLLVRALHGLAMVMHKKHEGTAVFDMLERALEIARRQKKVAEERNIRILTAQMHLVTGDLERALEKFHALIDENPRDFRPYLCQGIVYSLMDKKNEADQSFEIYRSLVPEEFPQKGFLDDVVLSARTQSKKQIEKELQN